MELGRLLDKKDTKPRVLDAYFHLLAALSLSSGGIPRKEDWYNLRRENFYIGSQNTPYFVLKVMKKSASVNFGLFSLAAMTISPVLTFMDFFGWPTDDDLEKTDVKSRMEQEMRR